jgi:lipoate-protein ligase A
MDMTVLWRLLETGPAPGPYTAALDEAIARSRAAGEVPDTLHLYRRRPPAVTLGYSLDAGNEIDIEYCRRKGIDIVRRLSGGGAIYTDDRQLVYSLSTKDLMPSSVPKSLALVCTALARGLSSLGAPAVFSPVNDVLVNGRKVSGSAQLRKWGVVLTHGTVLVDADREEMFRALRVPAAKLEKRALEAAADRVTSLREELGRLPPMEEVGRAVVSGFEKAFGAEAVPGSPTAAEKALALELVRTRYGNEEWNLGGGTRCSTG